jgi:hypothetical protein
MLMHDVNNGDELRGRVGSKKTTSERRTVMHATSETTIRELDARTGDGIHVRLLWNSQTNRVSVEVADMHSGELLECKVDSADALAALHDPYAYISPAATDCRLAA